MRSPVLPECRRDSAVGTSASSLVVWWAELGVLGFDPALSWSASLADVSVDRFRDLSSSSSILKAAVSPAARYYYYSIV